MPARFGGRPILHGLATLGASLLLLARAAGLDPTGVRDVRCRFSTHVFPGDAIVVEAWRVQGQQQEGEEEEDDGRARFVFRTLVERAEGGSGGGGSGGGDGGSSGGSGNRGRGDNSNRGYEVAVSQASVSFFTDEEMRRFEIEEEAVDKQQRRSAGGRSRL